MNELERLQTDLEAYLASCSSDPLDVTETPIQNALIARVRPRTAEEATGIQTKLQQALSGMQGRNSKAGISVIVAMPEIVQMEPNVRALRGRVRIVVEVHENILVNMGGNGNSPHGCESFALAVAELVNHQPFEFWEPLRAVSVLPDDQALINQKLVYRVTFETGLKRAIKPQVAVPLLAMSGNVLTLECSTPGAAIYYTLDGSYPGPGNAEALLYAGPVTLADSVLVRAAGWKNGFAGSVQRREVVEL